MLSPLHHHNHHHNIIITIIINYSDYAQDLPHTYPTTH